MPRSSRFARLALWAMVCVLLMKAALPMLATASAQMQGKALVEVCSVYGVTTVALDDHAPAPAHGTGAAGEHCVLSAIVALAAPAVQGSAPVARIDRQIVFEAALSATAASRDKSTEWRLRLKHGPPAVA